jgi:hypothetical protein
MGVTFAEVVVRSGGVSYFCKLPHFGLLHEYAVSIPHAYGEAIGPLSPSWIVCNALAGDHYSVSETIA